MNPSMSVVKIFSFGLYQLMHHFRNVEIDHFYDAFLVYDMIGY